MTSSENNPVENNAAAEPREDIIKTAVKFLQNPHVSKSPLAQTQKFLRSKGLTDQEIQLACERSGAYGIHYFSEKPPALPPALPQLYLQQHQQQSVFYRVRDTLQSVAIFSGLAYAVYLFYKKFIKPWLFGESKKKTIEESLADLNKTVTESVSELRQNLTEVRCQVDRISTMQTEGPSTHLQLQDLKSELTSVKGLLLNRKQFPSVSGTPLVPPSIPAWQLSSVPHEQDVEHDGKAEELMEIGSGSGSSETEVVTKNSDSSLEIM